LGEAQDIIETELLAIKSDPTGLPAWPLFLAKIITEEH